MADEILEYVFLFFHQKHLLWETFLLITHNLCFYVELEEIIPELSPYMMILGH